MTACEECRNGVQMEDRLGTEENQENSSGTGKNRRLFLIICFASVLVAIGIFLLLVNGYVNKHYSRYEVTRSVERQDTNTEKYVSLDGRILKYSRDGISEISATGKTVWTGSYDMNNPHFASCGNYILISDIGGKEAFIYNGKDTGKELTVDYEIRQACVSGQGLVALLLEDTSSDMIHIYDPYDVSSRLLVEIPTNVDEGYPLCIAFSPDGTSVVASYVGVTEGKPETRIAFYNFSEVGKNTDCLVGAKKYEDILVTDIRFLDSDHVCLFSDSGFYIWNNMKQPEQILKRKVDEQIKSIFYNKKYIGLILDNNNKKQPYRMQIYNRKGRCITNITFDNEYDQVQLFGKEILMHSSRQCSIFRINGVERFRCNVEEGVSYFFPGKRRSRYYLLDDSRIQEIKLVS